MSHPVATHLLGDIPLRLFLALLRDGLVKVDGNRRGVVIGACSGLTAQTSGSPSFQPVDEIEVGEVPPERIRIRLPVGGQTHMETRRAGGVVSRQLPE